jgi:hypothetical protein
VDGNTLNGLSKPELARALRVGGRTRDNDNMKPSHFQHVHPAITVLTLVLLALALVGALTATGTLP